MNVRTFNGSKLTGLMSGFSEYTTESSDAKFFGDPKSITPEEIMHVLKSLDRKFSMAHIEAAVKLFYEHANDRSNPHKVSLHQLMNDLGDSLYILYQQRGGTHDKDTFLKSLFSDLRLATIEEYDKSPEDNLVISVKDAKYLIATHDGDLNSHKELVNYLLPGDPPDCEPVYSFLCEYGVNDYIARINNETFTYIDPFGYMQIADKGTIPVDYSYTQPLIPLFGPTTNMIKQSNNFDNDYYTLKNLSVVENGETSPMKTVDATAFYKKGSGTLSCSLEFTSSSIEQHKDYTLSCFAKADSCNQLIVKINDKDPEIGEIFDVDITFDLKQRICSTNDKQDHFHPYLQELANDWYRCCITFNRNFSQHSKIKMIMAQEGSTELMDDVTDKPLMYIWGMQLEQTPCASPYIPTVGDPVTRQGAYLEIDLKNRWNPLENTVYCSFRTHAGTDIYPVCSLLNSDNIETAEVVFSNGEVSYTEYNAFALNGEDVHQVISDHVMKSDADYFQLSHSGSINRFNTALNSDDFETQITFEDKTTQPVKLLIGRDSSGNYFNGYFRQVTIYPKFMDKEQLLFLNGEKIDV